MASTQENDDDLADMGYPFSEIGQKLHVFALSKGTTVPKMAKKYGFSSGPEMILSAESAKERGFETLSQAAIHFGCHGSSLAKSLNVFHHDGECFRGFKIPQENKK